jgi:hypothetical protein
MDLPRRHVDFSTQDVDFSIRCEQFCGKVHLYHSEQAYGEVLESQLNQNNMDIFTNSFPITIATAECPPGLWSFDIPADVKPHDSFVIVIDARAIFRTVPKTFTLCSEGPSRFYIDKKGRMWEKGDELSRIEIIKTSQKEAEESKNLYLGLINMNMSSSSSSNQPAPPNRSATDKKRNRNLDSDIGGVAINNLSLSDVVDVSTPLAVEGLSPPGDLTENTFSDDDELDVGEMIATSEALGALESGAPPNIATKAMDPLTLENNKHKYDQLREMWANCMGQMCLKPMPWLDPKCTKYTACYPKRKKGSRTVFCYICNKEVVESYGNSAHVRNAHPVFHNAITANKMQQEAEKSNKEVDYSQEFLNMPDDSIIAGYKYSIF